MPGRHDNSHTNFVSSFTPCPAAQANWAATGGRTDMSDVWTQSKNGVWLEWILNRFEEALPASFDTTKRQSFEAIHVARMAYQKARGAGAPDESAKLQAFLDEQENYADAVRTAVTNPFV